MYTWNLLGALTEGAQVSSAEEAQGALVVRADTLWCGPVTVLIDMEEDEADEVEAVLH